MSMLALTSWPRRVRPRSASRARAVRYVRLVVEDLEARLAPSTTAFSGTAFSGNPNTQSESAIVSTAPPSAVLLGFEHGLTGWNVATGDAGLVSVVTQWDARGGPDPPTDSSAAPRSYSPQGATQHFGVLKTAGPNSVTTLSQTFTVAGGGQRLSLSAFFDTGDHGPFNDYGDIVLYKGDTPLVTLFAESILGGDGEESQPPVPLLAPKADGTLTRDPVGPHGNTPWTNEQYVLTEPGTYTLEARSANTGDNALDSYLGLGDVQFVEPTIFVGEPVVASTAAAVARTITFTDPVLDTFKVEIDSGTGTFVPYTGAMFTSTTPGGTNSFEFVHNFALPGTYNVVFRVHEIDQSGADTHRDAGLVVNVFTPQEFASLDNTATQSVMDPSQGAKVDVLGTAADGSSTHVNASLGGDAGASVFAGSYKGDPINASTGNNIIKVGSANSVLVVPTAYFDLRAAGVDDDSSLTTTITVEVDRAQDIAGITLFYSDGANWLPVQTDPNHPITKEIAGLDLATGKEIVKIHFTATKGSKPSIFDLHGTVFTVTLPAPPPPPVSAPVSTPVVSLSGPQTAAVTTTFSSDGGGTFVLRVSQNTELSASRTEASSSSRAASGAGTSAWYDAEDAVQLAQESLNINWLLAAMEQTAEDANPIRPVGATEELNSPALPATPETNNQNSDDSIEADALVATFADDVGDRNELGILGGPTGPVSALEPSLSRFDHEAPRNPSWAMVALTAGATMQAGCRNMQPRAHKAKRTKHRFGVEELVRG